MNKINKLYNNIYNMLEPWIGLAREWEQVTVVFLIVFAVLVFNFLFKLVLKQVYKGLQRTENTWDDAVYESIYPPVRLLVWLLGIGFAAEYLITDEESMLAALVDPTRQIAVIAIIAWFLLRLVRKLEQNYQRSLSLRDEGGMDQTTADALSKLLRASIFITAVLVMLQTLGYSITGVLAFGGVGGIAIGFAARDMLANFFGGLTVYMDRPFKVGDWIRSPDRDIEGTVEHIGWRTTRIRRFERRPIYVPNSIFTNIVVENPSRMSNRRIFETISLRYDDVGQVAPVVSEVRQMLEAHDDIDHDQLLMVYFDSFGAHSLDFFIYCFTVTRDWSEYHAVKQDVLLKIHEIVDEHEAEMAFPTTTLHVPEAVKLRQLEADSDRDQREAE